MLRRHTCLASERLQVGPFNSDIYETCFASEFHQFFIFVEMYPGRQRFGRGYCSTHLRRYCKEDKPAILREDASDFHQHRVWIWEEAENVGQGRRFSQWS